MKMDADRVLRTGFGREPNVSQSNLDEQAVQITSHAEAGETAATQQGAEGGYDVETVTACKLGFLNVAKDMANSGAKLNEILEAMRQAMQTFDLNNH